jgi:hypothetical protein
MKTTIAHRVRSSLALVRFRASSGDRASARPPRRPAATLLAILIGGSVIGTTLAVSAVQDSADARPSFGGMRSKPSFSGRSFGSRPSFASRSFGMRSRPSFASRSFGVRSKSSVAAKSARFGSRPVAGRSVPKGKFSNINRLHAAGFSAGGIGRAGRGGVGPAAGRGNTGGGGSSGPRDVADQNAQQQGNIGTAGGIVQGSRGKCRNRPECR